MQKICVSNAIGYEVIWFFSLELDTLVAPTRALALGSSFASHMFQSILFVRYKPVYVSLIPYYKPTGQD